MPEQMRSTCCGALLEVTKIAADSISAKCFSCGRDYAEVTGGRRKVFLYPEKDLVAGVKCQREGCKGVLTLNGANRQAYVNCSQCGEPHLRVDNAIFRWPYAESLAAKSQQ